MDDDSRLWRFVVGGVLDSIFTSDSVQIASISLSSNSNKLLDLSPALRRRCRRAWWGLSDRAESTLPTSSTRTTECDVVVFRPAGND